MEIYRNSKIIGAGLGEYKFGIHTLNDVNHRSLLDDWSFPSMALSLSWYQSRIGEDMGPLKVSIIEEDGSAFLVEGFYTVSGEGTSGTWDAVSVSDVIIPLKPFRVMWEYMYTGSYHGDIALDLVTVNNQTFDFEAKPTDWLRHNSQDSGLHLVSDAVPLNDSGDDIEWSYKSGGTSSSGTGPEGAYSGSEYIFVETSGSNSAGPFTALISPVFNS
ncbi:MAG: hypothetical protein LC687_05350 [Actinobacteria bacterium]|nr:hypothetical protein [Actinomycetota bacterium]